MTELKNEIVPMPLGTDQEITHRKESTILCVFMCNNGFAAGV